MTASWCAASSPSGRNPRSVRRRNVTAEEFSVSWRMAGRAGRVTGSPRMPVSPKGSLETIEANPLVDAPKVREQLERLLTHPLFANSKRYPALLAYAVEQTLLGNAGELKERIKESVLDGVIIVRPKDARKETREVVTSGIWVPPPGYYGLYPYWNMAYGQFYATSWSTEENIIIRVEVNMYNVKDEKLVWSAETDTVYSKDFDKLGESYAKSLVKQLKRDKVIDKK